MKKLTIILIMLLSLLLVGCSSKDVDLPKAVENTEAILAMQTETTISLQVTTSGLTAEDQIEFDEFISLLNGASLKYTTKFSTDTKESIKLSESFISFDLGGIAFNTTFFSETNLKDNQVKLIIETPKALNELIPFLSFDKQYLVLDLDNELEELDDYEYDKLLEQQREAHSKIMKLAKDVEKELKGLKIIEKQKDKKVNDETFTVYTFTLNDQSFKKLLKAYGDMILKDPELRDELDIDQDSIDEFNEFMDSIENVNIIGSKGVNFEYLINKDGYIALVDGVVDLMVDFDSLRENLDETIESSGVLNFIINFKQVNQNINSKDIVVQLPEVNENNSSDISELFKFGGMFDDMFDEDFNEDFDLDEYLEAVTLIYDLYFDDLIDDDKLDQLLDELDLLDSSLQIKEFIEKVKNEY